MRINKLIEEERLRSGLNATVVGELIGLNRLQIYRFEKGLAEPTIVDLKNLAWVFRRELVLNGKEYSFK
ncbi:hypothetical protein EFL81_10060 [Weissella confusa]|uniref:helix-turn-helix domain-containing protein n=1 Tax=Weissella confusa TaxID=1583 RepID=UPI00223C41BF|nr:hypothetical protein [Weissella confusa]MCS9997155.1 hypothetical protein [Weissella confusa]